MGSLKGSTSAETGTARRLLAPQSGEPDVVTAKRRKERPDLVPCATGFGALLPESRRRLVGSERHEIQVPARRDLVAVSVGLLEVMHRVQEQDRDVRPHGAQHMQQNDAVRLKARRDAGCGRGRKLLGDERRAGRSRQDLLEHAAHGMNRVVFGRRRARGEDETRRRISARQSVASRPFADSSLDQTGTGSCVRRGIDQQETPGRTVSLVGIENERSGSGDRDQSDLVQPSAVSTSAVTMRAACLSR